MKKTKIIFYITTILFSASILMGAYFELSGDPTSQEAMTHLGYPPYFNTIIGVAKILGIIALWQKFVPTLREWAYAGFFFDLIGAIVSIMAVGDPFSANMPAIISLVVLIISYITFRKLKKDNGAITTVRI